MKKLKPYTQSEFAGIAVNIDPIDMKDKYSVDCSNVDISTEGELNSMNGMEKQITTGLGYEITALWQVNGSNFAWYNTQMDKL